MELPAQLRIVLCCQRLQPISRHANRQRIEVRTLGKLENQTFRQIARADAGRVQHLNRKQRLLCLRRCAALLCCKLFQRDGQIAPLIQTVCQIETQAEKRSRLQKPRLPQLGCQMLRKCFCMRTCQIF